MKISIIENNVALPASIKEYLQANFFILLK